MTPDPDSDANDTWLWPAFLWMIIGFGGGTALAAPFILSTTLRDCTLGGMLFGGVPGALAGWLYGGRDKA